jgi:hypothetical protein
MMTGLSTNWLQNSCQGRRSVINKIENFIKAGHDKNAFGYGGDIAKNKPMSRVLQQIVQYQQITGVRRIYYLDSGKVDYDVAVTFLLADSFINGFKLVGYFGAIRRQFNEKNIF